MKVNSYIHRIALSFGVGIASLLIGLPRASQAQSLEEMAVMAMEIGQDDLVLRAIERGANVNGRVGDFTLVGHAVLNQRIGAAASLVRRGADVNLATGPSNQQRTPLAIALQTNRRDYDMFDDAIGLLRLGADPKTMQAMPARTAINFAHVTLYQAVISAGGSPSDPGPGGRIVFHLAADAAASALRRALTGCNRNEIDRVRSLNRILDISISEGADRDRAISGRPLLSYALSNGLFGFAEAILAGGASPTQVGSDNQRPLQVTYAYALPPGERCANSPNPSEEPAWRTAFRSEVETAREQMIARLLRVMLERN
jgi:hypothetical protein